MRLNSAVLSLVIALGVAAGSPALAADLRPVPQETLVVTPPAGWVVSVWQGGTIELAEFTPPGQTGDAYVDLLGYSVIPNAALKLPAGEAAKGALRDLEREEKSKGCRKTAQREHPSANGWYGGQYLCLGRDKVANPDNVELEFASTGLGRENVFRVWRTWRGSAAELKAMLKQRTGLDLNVIGGSGAGLSVNEHDMDLAFAALAPAFFADVARAAPCDLAAEPGCAAFDARLPADLAAQVKVREGGGFVAGFLAPGRHIVSRERFRQYFGATGADDGKPNRVIVILSPEDRAWTDEAVMTHTLTAVAYGQAADGGAVILADPKGALTPAQRAEKRAILVEASRQLWKPGLAPDTQVVVGH